mmetsp:Transcript_11450/g.19367  ORF Transcript_11450/g.19367 Transcript_11450/m.19367 type:complete len:157 (+) Transcript_11450:798-1268(+)
MVFYLNSISEVVSLELSSLQRNRVKSKYSFDVRNLKAFISVSPRLKEIRRGIKLMKPQEHMIYKILLDLLGSFIRITHGKTSTLYAKSYLPTVILFYKRVGRLTISQMVMQLKDSLKNLELIQKALGVSNGLSKAEKELEAQSLLQIFLSDILYLP